MLERVKKYFIQEKDNILNKNLFNKIREKLKLTEEQLPNSKLKDLLKLNNELIGDWIVNNADGFRIRDNGIIIVSKFMPKCFRGEKEEKIKEILNNPIRDDYMKKRFIKRYEKSIETHKNWQKPGFPPYSNLETFFYVYKIIWFNSRNCNFDKADLYELKVSKKITSKLNKKIEGGKDYFEWQFSDFRERKLDKLTPEKRIKREEAKRLRELKKQQELENKNE